VSKREGYLCFFRPAYRSSPVGRNVLPWWYQTFHLSLDDISLDETHPSAWGPAAAGRALENPRRLDAVNIYYWYRYIGYNLTTPPNTTFYKLVEGAVNALAVNVSANFTIRQGIMAPIYGPDGPDGSGIGAPGVATVFLLSY
jgi:hypothetical protein